MSANRRRLGLALALCAVAFALSGCERVESWLTGSLLRYVVKANLGEMPPQENDAQPMQTVKVRMRDGVLLETHIYLPEGKGPWPTILLRDPYGLSKYITCEIFVHYGYACVHQDVRGRWGSGGAWYPLINERNDGIDTIDWVLRQPWQNGKLAMSGESYLGLTQWVMADKLPPQVKTFVPAVSHGDFYQMIYHHGMFMQGIVGVWSSGLFQPLTNAFSAGDHWKNDIAGKFPAAGVDPKEFGPAWTAYHDYLMHPEESDPYWHSQTYDAIHDSYKGVHVPVFMLGRAYDFFLPGMLDTFRKLPTRDESVLYIGPGEHGGATGDQKIGHRNTHYFADTLAWLGHFLKGKPLPASLKPGYIVYINGADRWQHYADWPGNTAPMTLYLDKVASAHGCDKGVLSPQKPANETEASYRYDPRNPVPTRGGSFLVAGGLMPTASSEQKNDLCARSDVLSFSSAAFPKATLISGGMRVKLLVASDAPDTAFTVKVSEHFADGRVLNIRDDISTLSLRNGATHRLVYRPGDKVEIDYDLIPIAWELKPGSRLRVDISSSNFPVFNAHPNRAGLWSTVADPAIASETLYGGSLEIPVAP